MKNFNNISKKIASIVEEDWFFSNFEINEDAQTFTFGAGRLSLSAKFVKESDDSFRVLFLESRRTTFVSDRYYKINKFIERVKDEFLKMRPNNRCQENSRQTEGVKEIPLDTLW